MDGRMVRYMIALCVAFVAVACSTTSRLGEGEVLYTGVKKLRVNVPDTVEVPGGVSDNIKSTINVKPNNSLYSLICFALRFLQCSLCFPFIQWYEERAL